MQASVTPFLNIDIKKKNTFNFEAFYANFSEIYPDKPLPSRAFLEWLIGFVEGDGSFTVTTRGELQLVITQSTSDVQILIYIMNSLGFGKVIQQSKLNKTHRFIVQDYKNLLLICLLFNGNMVFFTRTARFQRFLAAFNEKSLKKNKKIIKPLINIILPTLSDYWLSGFTDAEGCFTLSLLKNSKAYRLRFILSQKWDANKTILDHILSLFGVGSVSLSVKPDNWQYICNGVKNTEAILSYFDEKSLKTKKKTSYLLWKNLRIQLINGNHLNSEKRMKMAITSKCINK